MLLFPQRVILAPFGRYAIHGYASRSTSEALLNHLQTAQARSTAHLLNLQRSVHPCVFLTFTKDPD